MAGVKENIHETSTTTGAGDFTVSAVDGRVRFSDATNGFGTGSAPDIFNYYITHRTADEYERGTGHMSDANTLVRDTVVANSVGTTAKISFTAGTKDVTCDLFVSEVVRPDIGMTGWGLAASIASNALTIELKTPSGNGPTTTAPARIAFPSATATTGTQTVRNITAATNLVISSGSTLGTSNGVAFRFWIVAFDDAGTIRLGAINCLDGTAILHLREHELASSSAEGGAGAADSTRTFYTGTAVTSKPYRILGFVEYSSGLTTAGTYNVAPTNVRVMGAGMPLPGDVVQVERLDDGDDATGTTTIPLDDTIPQNTEGNQYMSLSITPSAAANLLSVKAQGFYAHSVLAFLTQTLFRDSGADAVAANIIFASAGGATVPLQCDYETVADTVMSTTFNVRAGGNNAGTTTFNGFSSGRRYGGAMNSFLKISEVMA